MLKEIGIILFIGLQFVFFATTFINVTKGADIGKIDFEDWTLGEFLLLLICFPCLLLLTFAYILKMKPFR